LGGKKVLLQGTPRPDAAELQQVLPFFYLKFLHNTFLIANSAGCKKALKK
jgi:hypothetical protein